MWFLGMDVGTGGTRAVVVDGAGKLLAGASSEHAAFRTEHPGWAEQDPEDWWRAAQEAIRGVLKIAPEPRQPIAAIGLTGQMHGAVMLDEAGQVLRPALIWCDTRTQPQCDWLTEKIGYERLIELTCNPALPNFTVTKILWVKEHEPEIFAKIRNIMCPKDYVRYRLTGGNPVSKRTKKGATVAPEAVTVKAGLVVKLAFSEQLYVVTEEPVINEDDDTRSFTLIVEPYDESRTLESCAFVEEAQ